jgi:hypothetical protein
MATIIMAASAINQRRSLLANLRRIGSDIMVVTLA